MLEHFLQAAAEELVPGLKRMFVVAFIVRAEARTYLKGNDNGNGEKQIPAGMTTGETTATKSLRAVLDSF